MSVSISKPCSENWDEMNPTQKGAFCQKCAVNVVDFSNKSPNEIKETLKANLGGEMCGRFEKTQLYDFNQSYINWENQSRKTLQSKFLWACLIVFGMTIFTGCQNSSAQEKVDQISIILPYTNEENPNNIDDSLKTEPYEEVEHIKGKIAYIPFEEDIDTLIQESTCNIPENTIEPDSLKQQTKAIHSEFIMGRFVMPEIHEIPIENQESVEEIPERIDTPELEAYAFPNPTDAQAQLKIVPSYNGDYTITLFSIDGKALYTIFNGQLENREYSLPIDLTTYPNGLYLLRIQNDEFSKLLKLNKVG